VSECSATASARSREFDGEPDLAPRCTEDVAKTATVATFVAWGLLIPAAAGAKGLEQSLTIVSGPGLERPLIIERDEWGIPRNEGSSQALVIEGLLGGIRKSAVLQRSGWAPSIRSTTSSRCSTLGPTGRPSASCASACIPSPRPGR
jgi:hypothetical protein